MTQLTQDIAELTAKYGTMKGIRTADQIMRVVRQVEHVLIQKDNPFCVACMEKDCIVEPEGTCAMIREYQKHKLPF